MELCELPKASSVKLNKVVLCRHLGSYAQYCCVLVDAGVESRGAAGQTYLLGVALHQRVEEARVMERRVSAKMADSVWPTSACTHVYAVVFELPCWPTRTARILHWGFSHYADHTHREQGTAAWPTSMRQYYENFMFLLVFCVAGIHWMEKIIEDFCSERINALGTC